MIRLSICFIFAFVGGAMFYVAYIDGRYALTAVLLVSVALVAIGAVLSYSDLEKKAEDLEMNIGWLKSFSARKSQKCYELKKRNRLLQEKINESV